MIQTRREKLKLYYVSSLRSLSSVNYFELNGLTLFQRLESVSGQSGIMYEYILSCLIRDKSITLLVVKPLYCTFHYYILQKTIATEIDYNNGRIPYPLHFVNRIFRRIPAFWFFSE